MFHICEVYMSPVVRRAVLYYGIPAMSKRASEDEDIDPKPQMVGEVKHTYKINDPKTLKKLEKRWNGPIDYAIKGPNASRDARGLYPKGWLDY